MQLELAPVTLSGPTDNNGPNYSTQFLLRYGLTDRLELRMFGIGFFEIFHSPQRTTGFAPLAVDMKTNLWRESKNHWIPAAGLEVYLQTEFGSPALGRGCSRRSACCSTRRFRSASISSGTWASTVPRSRSP